MKNKILIINIILAIFIVIISIILSNSISNKFNKIENKYKQNVGTKILINNDSLMIIDYSVLKESYTLENGLIINKEFVTK